MPPCSLQGHRAVIWVDAECSQRSLRQVLELAISKDTPVGFITAEEWVGAHDLICGKSQDPLMSQIGDGRSWGHW